MTTETPNSQNQAQVEGVSISSETELQYAYDDETERYLEQLYLGEWDIPLLISTLKSKLTTLSSKPEGLKEILIIVRILREANDPGIPDYLWDLLDQTYDGNNPYGWELWLIGLGSVVILEFLDIIVAYRRPEDIPRLMNWLTYDLFQIPSHILMLIRKHRWFQLWDTINGRYNIQEEYDPMIRTQHYLTGEALKAEVADESELLDSHRKELAALRRTLRSTTTPVVFVEGKTDRAILETAYAKLFPGTAMPFSIKECDPLADTAGGAGGAQTLARLISTIRQDSPFAALALFDYDKEGIDAFDKLPAYFVERRDTKYRPGKISRGGRSAALLLPTPKGREKYADLMNLPIEFLFEDRCLGMRNALGRGLVFRYPELEVRVRRHGNPIIEVRTSDLAETREILDGKIVFAYEIVPTLSEGDFEAFKELFWTISDILLSEMKPPVTA